MSIEQIARICHEVNKAWCEYTNDFSQKSWENAEEWQRSSAMKGVEFVLDNPNAGDSAQHDEWMRVKFAEGWVWGVTKDPEKKLHPCLVAFEHLPQQQQFKDKLFRTVVLAYKG